MELFVPILAVGFVLSVFSIIVKTFMTCMTVFVVTSASYKVLRYARASVRVRDHSE